MRFQSKEGNERRLKVCVVGYGSIGRRHAQNALSLGWEVCFLRSGLAQTGRPKMADEQRVAQYFNFEEARAFGPQLAIIATPTHRHLQSAMAFLEAGAHLLIEKPISHQLSGLNAMAKKLNERKLRCFHGYMLRLDPSIQSLRHELQRSKEHWLSSRVEWSTFLPGWHPWEDYRQSYAARRECGGGVTLTCSHEIDLACWLFGDVVRVHAVGGRRTSLGIEAEDCVDALLEHRKGFVTSLHLNYAHLPGFRQIRVIGENSALRWDFFEGSVRRWVGSNKSETLARREIPFDEVYRRELEHVEHCLRTGDASPLDFAEGLESFRVALTVLRSLEEGRPVELAELENA